MSISKDHLNALLDALWCRAGFDHSKWLQSTYIKIEKFDLNKGIIEGKGLWGTEGVPFLIDTGITGEVKIECGCAAAKTFLKDQNTGPCPHIMRVLVEIESKLNDISFKEAFEKRMAEVLPF